MKKIEIILKEEDDLPFWTDQTVEINVKNYGEFTLSDKTLLIDLAKWIKGEEKVPIYKKEADQA